jgi:hypothetical protein
MAIVPKFKPSDIAKKMQAHVEKIENAVLQRLQFIGETFVKNARSVDTYKDQTGNLRSSIGYVILKNGEQIASGFPGSTAVGKSRSLTVAQEVGSKHPKGLVVVVVAGMQYAAVVESKNYDVLTSSSIQAQIDLEKAVLALKEQIGKMK